MMNVIKKLLSREEPCNLGQSILHLGSNAANHSGLSFHKSVQRVTGVAPADFKRLMGHQLRPLLQSLQNFIVQASRGILAAHLFQNMSIQLGFNDALDLGLQTTPLGRRILV